MGTEPESRSARSDLVYRANTSGRSFEGNTEPSQ